MSGADHMDGLELRDKVAIDALADEFEQALRAGQSPRIEDFAARVREVARLAAMRELVHVEIELRRSPGPRADATVANQAASSNGPDHNDGSDVRLANTRPHDSTASGSGRLEVRCPNCHNPTEVAVDTTLTDLTCGSCGSHFSLVDQTKATRLAPSLTRLGRFELIERLGVGGFGSVWKARDKELDRTVAIKIPRAGGMTPEEQEKFFREARAAAQLRHPNIVSVFEVGRDGESIYIVSEFIRGATLGDWLTGQQLTNREAAELCAKIADALDHAHEQGVVHRDLKPANIMMDYDGQPHLMDFGLARREAGEVTMTIEGQILGTPAYMSPEQAEGEAHTADRRSDVYSLGVVLFQLLTGELPFRGNARMIIKQVVHDEPPSPRKLNSNIKRDLETITLKCLEKTPAKRYQTAHELSEELRRFLRGDTIHARPVNRIERAWRWSKRKPEVAAFLLLLIAATTVSTALAVWALRAERQVAQERDQVLLETSRTEAALETARKSERTAQERLEIGLIATGDAALALGHADARDSYREARDIAGQLGHSDQSATTGMLLSYADQPAPLIGDDGQRGGVGGFKGHNRGRISVAFHPDNRHAISVSTDGSIKLWDVHTGAPIATFPSVSGGFEDIAFSPDARRILTAGVDGEVRLWDLSTKTQLRHFSGHTERVVAVAFSPNGKMALSGGHDAMVRLWDIATGKEIQTMKAPSYVGHVAFAPDGHRALSSGEPSAIVLWDLDSGKTIRTIDAEGALVFKAVFSPDGRTVLSGDLYHGMHLWDIDTGEKLRTFHGHSASVTSVALSPDAKLAVSGSYDRTVRLWNVVTGEQIRVLSGHHDAVRTVAFSNDGRFVLSGDSAGQIKLWKVELDTDISALRGHKTRVTRLASVLNGRGIASSSFDRSIRLWDVATGLPIRTIATGDSPVWDIAVARDSRSAITAHQDGSLLHWDLTTGKQISKVGQHTEIASAVAFCCDETSVLSASSDHTVQQWDLKSGKNIRTFSSHEDKVRTVAVLPDGRTAISGSFDNTLKLWDIGSGSLLNTLEGHRHWVMSVAISPDGRKAASAGWDRNWALWDLQSRKNVLLQSASSEIVPAIAISPDGKFVLSGSMDKSVALWATTDGRRIREMLFHDDGVTSITFCPDGRTAFSGSQNGLIRRLQFDRPARYDEFSQSLPRAREALTHNLADGAALLEFGKWYAFRGVYDWAAEFFEKARAAGAKVNSLELARCYWQLNRREDAARELQVAIEQKEDSPEYLLMCLEAVNAQAANVPDKDRETLQTYK